MTETNTTDDYFDDSEKTGAPSALLKNKGDFVQGEVVDVRKVDKTKFGTNDVELNEDGSKRQQLRIVLQTEYRNWDKVAKIPTAKDGSPRPGSEDDGKRAIYVPKYTNIYQALGDAIHEADVRRVELGGWFGIKITELEDTGKGNPLKKHAAKYKAPEKPETPAEEDPFGEFEAPAAGKAVAEDKTISEPAPAAKEEPKSEAPVEEPPF